MTITVFGSMTSPCALGMPIQVVDCPLGAHPRLSLPNSQVVFWHRPDAEEKRRRHFWARSGQEALLGMLKVGSSMMYTVDNLMVCVAAKEYKME